MCACVCARAQRSIKWKRHENMKKKHTGCIAPPLRVCPRVRVCVRVLGVVFVQTHTTSVCTPQPSSVFDFGKQLICLVRVCLGL